LSAWKGLILAGGNGSRLAPLTQAVNKHLLPVYDKPMIYYPLTTLMLAGVRETVIVTSESSVAAFRALLGDGTQWGLKLSYCVQESASGVAGGLLCAKPELSGSRVMMILGDNIFYGSGLPAAMDRAMANSTGATVFGYEVSDPRAFGVMTLDLTGKVLAIEEKPANPKSRIAVTGLYLYEPDVFEKVAALKPSARGELEITDLNQLYLGEGRLAALNLGRGVAWLDGGTPKDLYDAGQFIEVLEARTGLHVACPEEIALRKGYIDRKQFARLAERYAGSDYGAYLDRVLSDPLLPA
jgi:glucose-1-phosphate thymidylyltransferase